MPSLHADREVKVPPSSSSKFKGFGDRWIGWAGSGFTVLLAVHLGLATLRRHLYFDDALMFYRYALHLRQAHAIAWDPGGGPVFGLTSIPWLLLVWAGSFLIRDPATLVVALSCATGLAAFWAAALLISRRCESPLLSRASAVFPMVGIPLLLDIHFSLSYANGMETMLGLLLNFIFIACLLRFLDVRDVRHALLLSLAGALAVLTRPEAFLCVGLVPLLAWYILGERARPLRPIVAYVGGLGALLGADLLFDRMYFGSALPLSFYIKAVHGYEGYALYLNPFAYTMFFFGMAAVPLIATVSVARRRDLALLSVFGIPLGLTLLYFLTPVQIMGLGGRYYVPFLPFLIVPAALVVDNFMMDEARARVPVWRLVAALVTVVLCGMQFSEHLYGPIGMLMARKKTIYAAPHFVTGAETPLPSLGTSWAMCTPMGRIARSISADSSIGASEVGVVGAMAPGTRVLDLAGLNDAHIAHQGFSMDYVLAKNPEVIWFPHNDYTRIYGVFASDPRLLERYAVYAGAFDLGLAVRRDVPEDSALAQTVRQVWAETYPGVDMDEYRVRSVVWNPYPVPPQVRAVTSAAP